MKYLVFTLLSVVLFSCKKNDNNNQNINSVDIIGNWYSVKDNNYQEYYFTKNKMYEYSPYSGDVLEFNYIIKHNSIYRYFNHPELKNHSYDFYDNILQIDSLHVKLKTKSLIKLNKKNTLQMFLEKKIDYKTFDKFGIYRKNLSISLDSLAKKAGQ